MIKRLRLHILFLMSLGLMVFGHLGGTLFKPLAKTCAFPHGSSIALSSFLGSSPPHNNQQTSGGSEVSSAKAFGVPSLKQNISCKSVKELDSLFRECGFDLSKAKKDGEVPRLYLDTLPSDMKKKRKAGNSTFIRVLLPLILQVNEKILADRARLLAMKKRQDAGGHLRQSEKKWLCALAKKYRCKSSKITSLLFHVDIVPPSLALAQATLETGGGRSSAALKKNSTFGHMKTKTSVARFESLLANVEAYIVNLNRHRAYKSFRTLRAAMRAKNQKLCSMSLAKGLTKYSIRKQAYIRDVQYIIRTNGLAGYDHITLAKHPGN